MMHAWKKSCIKYCIFQTEDKANEAVPTKINIKSTYDTVAPGNTNTVDI